MKKIKMSLALVIGAVVFSGCIAEKAGRTSDTLNVGKVIYVGAKTAYVEIGNTSGKLKTLDKVLVTADGVNEVMIAEKDRQKTRKKSLVSTSQEDSF